MNKREKLISLAIKYQGEYNFINKAIIDDEDVEPINCDNALTILDKEYPKELLDLKRPPYVLFYKGNLNLLKKDKISIVGSRMPSKYALEATIKLVLNNKDKVIVSGMAKGIDAKAHEFATNTIGILGSGIDYIYPIVNKELYERIAKEGLLLSEYPFKCKPYAYHFPFRNRIIAALSECVYIMEVHEKSGTLTTINEALELGKDVKVLPFDIFNESGIFNNELINEGALIIKHNDVIN